MHFEELLHWNNGQFLQPHHFQYLQRQSMDYIKNNRAFSLPYPWGLINFEIDSDALASGRVVVRQFSAVLGDGTPLSMPGNCLLSPLDLTEVLAQNPNEITVYIALPLWSEFEANLCEGSDGTDKRRFVVRKRQVRDENSGDNEITLITRRMNVQLRTNFDDNKNAQILPVLKLSVLSHDKTSRALEVNKRYFPPFIVLTADSVLFGLIQGLVVDIRRCRDKALDILTVGNFTNENLSGYNAYTILRLKTLNVYEMRLSSLLAAKNATPFQMYMELTSLLSELMSYDPFNSIRSILRYNHDDSAPQFFEIIKDIRSFILQEGSADYIRLNFNPLEDGMYLYTPITPEESFRAKDAYLAVTSDGKKETVVKSVEEGDTFKFINPQSKQQRIRGIKLTEEPYPPRFLPILNKTIWFKLDIVESARVWREITDERGIVVDYVKSLFPNVQLSLYLTIGDK
ncbi:MAG: type VI secretion system baseplate subunit TssK [Spirochaetaceae bacterium]|jgi:type VI secretion system protein ImpJ|nr:type VI secretion system baseplate subunit TssK [Spirochaetaceae bacterium]